LLTLWSPSGFISRAERGSPKDFNDATANEKCFYVYIISSLSGTLYVGLTDDLSRRLREHREGLVDAFTRRYNVNRLMYYEMFRAAGNAERREKQIKKFRRAKKVALFASSNPKWVDFSDRFSWLNKDLLM
jgi:putative endonuclease